MARFPRRGARGVRTSDASAACQGCWRPTGSDRDDGPSGRRRVWLAGGGSIAAQVLELDRLDEGTASSGRTRRSSRDNFGTPRTRNLRNGRAHRRPAAQYTASRRPGSLRAARRNPSSRSRSSANTSARLRRRPVERRTSSPTGTLSSSGRALQSRGRSRLRPDPRSPRPPAYPHAAPARAPRGRCRPSRRAPSPSAGTTQRPRRRSRKRSAGCGSREEGRCRAPRPATSRHEPRRPLRQPPA